MCMCIYHYAPCLCFYFGIAQSHTIQRTENALLLQGSLYETCAVVGNSGILNRYQFGSKIDMHDLVIRFNLAPTIGYESTTGTKTSFRLVNSQHAGHHEGDEAVIQQMQSDVGIQLYLKVRAESPEKRYAHVCLVCSDLLF